MENINEEEQQAPAEQEPPLSDQQTTIVEPETSVQQESTVAPTPITTQPLSGGNQQSQDNLQSPNSTLCNGGATNAAGCLQRSTMSTYPSAPESLTSAPPSYSFVMRQVATRQRPRFMGTFVSSPSFVQHAPPPTYATTFDLYVDQQMTPITTPPPNTYGFHPVPVVCSECGNLVLTTVRSQVTMCTHLCAGLLCLCFCWICAPLPYLLRSCKNVFHYCPICGKFLGMYSPTNTTVSVSV